MLWGTGRAGAQPWTVARVAVREWHKGIPNYWLKEGTEVKYRQALREIARLPARKSRRLLRYGGNAGITCLAYWLGPVHSG